jgi:NAD(P)-dependent dehydrogenase (short-subunit alcohol dehydrogenase family)
MMQNASTTKNSQQSILITGASSGIGLALARHYLQSGDIVYACGRDITTLNQLKDEFEHCRVLSFDITDKAQIDAIAGEIDAPLSTIILNAGTCEYLFPTRPEGCAAGATFDSATFAQIINTNLTAVGYCLEAFLPHIQAAGQLVLISSSVTLLPLKGAEAYGASKAGLNYLAETLRLSLAPLNIGVTVVQPGFVKTPLTDKNHFAMPFIVDAQQAATIIAKGIARQRAVIRFPWQLMLMLRLISLLPFQLRKKLF